MVFFYILIAIIAVLLLFFGVILWLRHQQRTRAVYRSQAEQQDILIQMILQDERALTRLISAEQQKKPEATEKELRQLIMYRLQSGQRHVPDPPAKVKSAAQED